MPLAGQRSGVSCTALYPPLYCMPALHLRLRAHHHLCCALPMTSAAAADQGELVRNVPVNKSFLSHLNFSVGSREGAHRL